MSSSDDPFLSSSPGSLQICLEPPEIFTSSTTGAAGDKLGEHGRMIQALIFDTLNYKIHLGFNTINLGHESQVAPVCCFLALKPTANILIEVATMRCFIVFQFRSIAGFPPPTPISLQRQNGQLSTKKCGYHLR